MEAFLKGNRLTPKPEQSNITLHLIPHGEKKTCASTIYLLWQWLLF